MIDDPILLTGGETDWYSAKASNKRFVRTVFPDTKENLALYHFSETGADIFAIVEKHSYWIGNQQVTKETLLDLVMEKYPDHFEWLLFHPEWLQ